VESLAKIKDQRQSSAFKLHDIHCEFRKTDGEKDKSSYSLAVRSRNFKTLAHNSEVIDFRRVENVLSKEGQDLRHFSNGPHNKTRKHVSILKAVQEVVARGVNGREDDAGKLIDIQTDIILITEFPKGIRKRIRTC
jgi:hypothetical protein